MERRERLLTNNSNNTGGPTVSRPAQLNTTVQGGNVLRQRTQNTPDDVGRQLQKV